MELRRSAGQSGFTVRDKDTLTGPPEVIRRKVIRRLDVKVIGKPTFSKRTISDVGHTELLAGVDQAVRLVDRLKGGVLCLDGIDLCDCGWLIRNLVAKVAVEHILELALRRVAAEHSERPIYLVLPALRSSSRAGIDSSRGVSIAVSMDHISPQITEHTGIDAMEIVQIRGKTKPFNSAFDILFDVRGRIGD